MSQFREMEWNAKWDWENFGGYGSKAAAIESGKKAQLADWVIADDGDIIHGGGNSGSDAGRGGSISASTDSGIHTIEGSFSNKMDSSAEASLGLKLGKRTYFENSGSGGGGVMPTTRVKKTKSCGQNALPVCCQVEGCNIDLSEAKEYHRKHRVCDSHSKCSRVIVGGLERRFCQQCSRFHSLSEFDEKKRSCRKRLSDHNARRRKPPQETIQFDPSRQATPYYGGKQEMSCGNSGWESNSKFTLTQGYSPSCFKSNGGGDDQLLHMPAPKPIINMQTPPKDSTSNPGSKGALISCAPEFGRALSLLSTNSCEHHQMHVSDSTMIHANAIPQGDFWLQHSTHPNFQEIQLLKTPYDAAAANFYSNILN